MQLEYRARSGPDGVGWKSTREKYGQLRKRRTALRGSRAVAQRLLVMSKLELGFVFLLFCFSWCERDSFITFSSKNRFFFFPFVTPSFGVILLFLSYLWLGFVISILDSGRQKRKRKKYPSGQNDIMACRFDVTGWDFPLL
jgi:hypothetical protein